MQRIIAEKTGPAHRGKGDFVLHFSSLLFILGGFANGLMRISLLLAGEAATQKRDANFLMLLFNYDLRVFSFSSAAPQ